MTVVIRLLRIPLFRFLVPLVAFALAWLSLQIIRAILDGIAWILRHVPIVGGYMARGVVSASHSIHNGIGYLALAMENAAVGFLLGMLLLVDDVARAIEWTAHESGRAFQTLRHVVIPRLLRAALSDLKWDIAEIRKALGWTRGRVLDPAFHRIQAVAHELADFEGRFARWARAIEATIASTIPGVIRWPEIKIGDLSGDIARVWKWIRSHIGQVTAAAAAGIVLAAVGRLGWNWLRCSNVGKAGKAICRTPSGLLNDLLALTADFLILSNICTVIPWLEEAFSVVVEPLVSTLATAAAKFPCPGSSRPTRLVVPPLNTSPAEYAGQLYLP